MQAQNIEAVMSYAPKFPKATAFVFGPEIQEMMEDKTQEINYNK